MTPPIVCPRPGAGTTGPDCPLAAARIRRAVLIAHPAAPDLVSLIRGDSARPNPPGPAMPPTRPELPRPLPVMNPLNQKGVTHE